MLTSYLVDTVADVVADDGLLSLREAIQAANTNAAVYEAAAGQSSSNAIDTIAFRADLMGATLRLSLGELTVSEAVNVRAGSAERITIDAAGLSRALTIAANSQEVLIDSITFANGVAEFGGGISVGAGTLLRLESVDLIDNVATGAAASQGGGGLFSDGATVVMTGGRVSGNIASGVNGSGGGLFNAGGDLKLRGVTLMENIANRAGGAIEQSGDQADLSLRSVVMSNNTAGSTGQATPGNGGALHISGNGDAIIIDSQVVANVAAREGGGLWNGGGTMSVIDTVISGNRASGNAADDGGGGIFNNGGTLDVLGGRIDSNLAAGTSGSGGGIFSTAGRVTIDQTLIQSNSANRAGGGIEIVIGDLLLTDVTLGGPSSALGNIAGPDDSAAPGNGGGLHVSGNGGATLTRIVITGGVVQSNIAASEGGGLWNQLGARMTISGRTRIGGNRAHGESNSEGGGGVFNNGGVLSISDVTISNNAVTGAFGGGGGVANDGGIVTISDSMINGNFASGVSGSGGGLLNVGNGTIQAVRTEISDNVASRAGGGIEDASNRAGLLAIELIEVLLSDNIAGVTDQDATAASPGNGGGLHITGQSDSRIIASAVTENQAAKEGGGLWNGSGTMTVLGTQIVGNIASGNASDDGGGGIFNNGGDVVIQDTTLSGNVANGINGSGGGLFSIAGNVTATDTSFEFNGANRAGGGIEIVNGSITLVDSNLINNDVDGTATAGKAMPGNGGGLHVSGMADVMLQRGIVFGNVAASEGGGLWNQVSSTMTIDGTLIDSNTALGDDADNGGGGVFNNGGDLIIRNAKISSNFADGINGSGGDIFNANGQLTLHQTLIGQNSANRAGGGIEQSGDDAYLDLFDVTLDSNLAGPIGFAAPGNGGGLHLGNAGNGIVRNSLFVGNTAARDGGGIWNGAGSLNVIDTTIQSNIAMGDLPGQGGGGIYNLGTLTISRGSIFDNQAVTGLGNGGGVLNKQFANSSINHTTLSGNDAARAGGGIENEGNLLVGQSTLSDNTAGINGGALHITGLGIAIFTASTIRDNIAGNEGGGLWNSADGLIAVQNSLIAANRATDGGGVFNDGDDGDIRLINTTVSGNSASGRGGGLRSEGGEIMLTSVTFTNNSATSGGGIDILLGTAILESSIVGNNVADTGPDLLGQIMSAGFNVIGNTADANLSDSGMTDRLNVDPRLDALADNGGRTLTHALLDDSPALNNGDPAGVSADQRMVSRPKGPASDSGAFESALSGLFPAPLQNSQLPADVNGDGDATPLDALIVINFLAQDLGTTGVAAEGESVRSTPLSRPDVNGDRQVTPRDALNVINYLASRQAAVGSDVGSVAPAISMNFLDSIARDEIQRRQTEIDEMLLEQLAIDVVQQN